MAARPNTTNTSGNEAEKESDEADHRRPWKINNSLNIEWGLMEELILKLSHRRAL